MDWSDKVQDMMQSWTRTQQRMWSSWLETMQGPRRSLSKELWERTVDTWQESVDNTLEAQSGWMQTWAESLKELQGSPESVTEWANRSQQGMKHWQETQKRLWRKWFELLRKTPPGAPPNSPEEVEALLAAWQASAREALEAQIDMVSAWARGDKK